jgi:hypothetical protein
LGDNVPGLVTTFAVDEVMSEFITCAGDAVVTAERKRAARPATCGAAIDVPDIVAIAVVEEIPAETMPDPGANMSRHAPKFE